MDMNALPNAAVMDDGGQVSPPIAATFPIPTAGQDLACTDLADTDDRMRHLERLANVGMLTGTAAHEIKNALVGVKTFVDLLACQHPDCELAALAASEVSRIQGLVGSLLHAAARPEKHCATVRLHEVLRHVITLVQQPLRSKRLTLETAFTCGPDTVAGSADQFKQAFLNVVLNAIEASLEGGVIQVRTRVDDATLTIAIQDFGAGIRPENLRRLFEPFFTTKAEGTGLGLNITRRIIREHGGTIEVSSMPHEGATFAFTLPLQPG